MSKAAWTIVQSERLDIACLSGPVVSIAFEAFEPGVLPVCRFQGHRKPVALGCGEMREGQREVMLILRLLTLPFERELHLGHQKRNAIRCAQHNLLDGTRHGGHAAELPRAV